MAVFVGFVVGDGAFGFFQAFSIDYRGGVGGCCHGGGGLIHVYWIGGGSDGGCGRGWIHCSC